MRKRAAPRWYWVLLLALIAGPLEAQYRGVRFEITQVGDTTFRFPRGSATWVTPCRGSICGAGQSGIAVDPRQRDVLVARFKVARVDSGLVTAVITGQTTRVATEHIAVITEPPKPWYKGITFWAGTVFGIVIGALITG